jgi:hypothetical protein
MKKTTACFLATCYALILITFIMSGNDVSAEEEITIFAGDIASDGVLVTEEGAKYRIDPADLGGELLKNEGQKVLVTGAVTESGGEKIIKVSSYQLWSPFGTSDKKGESED